MERDERERDEEAQPSAATPVVAGPQAAPAATPGETPAASGQVLTDEQRALLGAVLNRLLPATATAPGAGDLGVATTIEQALVTALPLRRIILDMLAAIQIAGARLAGADFLGLDAELQEAVLQAVEEARPAAFAALVDHAYRGYYLLPAVHAAIGYDGRPPQPRGYHLPPFDPTLLDRQRQRAPFWRPTAPTGG